MSALRSTALALVLTSAAALAPWRAAAQAVPPPPIIVVPHAFVPQPQYYELSTDPFDARALWVQPAGMVKRREASISGMLTADHSSDFKIGQYGLTVSSGGLAFGWQHDRLAPGVEINTYAVGLAAGTPRAALGADHRWYRGSGTSDGSWDIGGWYQALPTLELSTVWRDLGSPVFGSNTINATLVPGIALHLPGGAAQFGVDWEVVTHGWSTSALRAGASVKLPMNLMLNVRGETDGRLSARSLAIGLSWSPSGARFAIFDATQRTGPDQLGGWAAAVSSPFRRRRFGG